MAGGRQAGKAPPMHRHGGRQEKAKNALGHTLSGTRRCVLVLAGRWQEMSQKQLVEGHLPVPPPPPLSPNKEERTTKCRRVAGTEHKLYNAVLHATKSHNGTETEK